MRALLQRVAHASVTVAGEIVGKIDHGLLVLLGVGPDDTATDRDWLLQKIIQLRIFSDDAGKMNLSVQDVGGGILVVSQFTLFADSSKGNRPSFTGAAPPTVGQAGYEDFVAQLRTRFAGVVATGRFGADMQVDLCNDGPVTIWLDSRER